MSSPSSGRPAYACPRPGMTKLSTAASQGRCARDPASGAAVSCDMGSVTLAKDAEDARNAADVVRPVHGWVVRVG